MELSRSARQSGAARYVGDGNSRLPLVDVDDLAQLYVLALEKAPAGSSLHAVAEEGVPIRQVAEVIGRHLDLPVVAVSPDEASEGRVDVRHDVRRSLDGNHRLR